MKLKPWIVLAGMLWLGIIISLPEGAIAVSVQPYATIQLAKNQAAQLPPAIAPRLKADLSRRVNIPPGKLRVVEATPKTWGDGCLGLARSDEMCSQAMVNGWRVVLSNGDRRWVYRTDQQGRVYRLEAGK